MNHYRKYHNKPLSVDGVHFASQKEYKRWLELQMLEKAGKIIELNRQQKFPFDKLKLPSGRIPSYISDFTYKELEDVGKVNGISMKASKHVVEDTKGMVTDLFKLKWALMKYFYDIEVKII